MFGSRPFTAPGMLPEDQTATTPDPSSIPTACPTEVLVVLATPCAAERSPSLRPAPEFATRPAQRVLPAAAMRSIGAKRSTSLAAVSLSSTSG